MSVFGEVPSYSRFYALLSEAAAGSDPLTAFDVELGGRNLDFLHDIVRAWGIGTGSLVVDGGCGTGRLARELVRRHGAKVIAVDPLEDSLALAAQRGVEEGVEARVSFRLGTLQALPVPSTSVDLVWCRDVFNHVVDMQEAFTEVARVLKPQGALLLYSGHADEPFSPEETRRVLTPLSLHSATLDSPSLAKAARAAGLHRVMDEPTSEAHSPFLEGFSGNEARDALRLARIVRLGAQAEIRFGEGDLARWRALLSWRTMWWTGRIHYRVQMWTPDPTSGFSARDVVFSSSPLAATPPSNTAPASAPTQAQELP